MIKHKLVYPLLYILILILVLGLGAWQRMTKPPELSPILRTGAMQLPPDYRTRFVHYLTVDRVDNTIRYLYIEAESLARLERRAALPEGSQIVIEAYYAALDDSGNPLRDSRGHFIAGAMFEHIHMAEKRSTWQIEDLATTTGAIDWNFMSFDAQTFQRSSENRNDCFACHDGAFSRDMIFSRPRLDDFLGRGVTGYLYCNRPNRGNCL